MLFLTSKAVRTMNPPLCLRGLLLIYQLSLSQVASLDDQHRQWKAHIRTDGADHSSHYQKLSKSRILSAQTMSNAGTSVIQTSPLRELRFEGLYEAFAYSPSGETSFPLLLYLHGAGEMSGDLQDILSEGATGTPAVELEHGRALSKLKNNFVVVAPHTPHGWVVADVSRLIDVLLNKTRSGLSIDPKRLYITGHSMGGGAALDVAAQTKRFAACVPVAPGDAPDPTLLKGVPVWAFHGHNDVVVPSRVSEDLIKSLRDAGVHDEEAKLTLYDSAPTPPGWPDSVGHASTIPAYSTPELYDWLLEHRLDDTGSGNAND